MNGPARESTIVRMGIEWLRQTLAERTLKSGPGEPGSPVEGGAYSGKGLLAGKASATIAENCQVGFFVGYTGPTGHALIDWELYLHEVLDRRPRLRSRGPTSASPLRSRGCAPCSGVSHAKYMGAWPEVHHCPCLLATKRDDIMSGDVRSGAVRRSPDFSRRCRR
jgi:hypothetical protein